MTIESNIQATKTVWKQQKLVQKVESVQTLTKINVSLMKITV